MSEYFNKLKIIVLDMEKTPKEFNFYNPGS